MFCCAAARSPIEGIDKIHTHSGVKIFTCKTTPLLMGVVALSLSLIALGILAKLHIVPIPASGMYALATFCAGVLALDAGWLLDLIKRRRSAEQILKEGMIYYAEEDCFKDNLQKLMETQLPQSKVGCFTSFVRNSTYGFTAGIIIKSTRSHTEAHIYAEKTEYNMNNLSLRQNNLHWQRIPADTDWSSIYCTEWPDNKTSVTDSTDLDY